MHRIEEKLPGQQTPPPDHLAVESALNALRDQSKEDARNIRDQVLELSSAASAILHGMEGLPQVLATPLRDAQMALTLRQNQAPEPDTWGQQLDDIPGQLQGQLNEHAHLRRDNRQQIDRLQEFIAEGSRQVVRLRASTGSAEDFQRTARSWASLPDFVRHNTTNLAQLETEMRDLSQQLPAPLSNWNNTAVRAQAADLIENALQTAIPNGLRRIGEVTLVTLEDNVAMLERVG